MSNFRKLSTLAATKNVNYVEARSVEHLQDVVKTACDLDLKIRTYGSGFSWNADAISADIVISLKHLTEVEILNGFIRVGTGITLGELHKILESHNLMLKGVPGTEGVTLGGILANACYSGHPQESSISSYVTEVKIINNRGENQTIGLFHPMFKSVIVSKGQMGIIYEVVIQVFQLNYFSYQVSYKENIGPVELVKLIKNIARGDSLQNILYWPSKSIAHTFGSKVITSSTPRSIIGQFVGRFVGPILLFYTYLMAPFMILCDYFNVDNSITKIILYLMLQFVKLCCSFYGKFEYTGSNYDVNVPYKKSMTKVLHTNKNMPIFSELKACEYSIPVSKFEEFVIGLHKLQLRSDFHLFFRLTKSIKSEGYMDPISICSEENNQFVRIEFDQLKHDLTALYTLLDNLNAKPSWGKFYPKPTKIVEQTYPQYDLYRKHFVLMNILY
jgi:hypothetical protein